MKRVLIRRSDAIKALRESIAKKPSTYSNGILASMDVIDFIPAVDAVEVVRCMECEMANPCSDEREMYCTMSHSYKRKNYYCADGQRREDGLHESLKRGLEEAIAYENGEIECRTETREDGDA